MKISILLFFIVLNSIAYAQNNILFIGNTSMLCKEGIEDKHITLSKKIPESLVEYDALFIFSSAQSILDSNAVEKILVFLESGKGIYLGSENWPLQAESNQLTSLLFSKQSWGNFSDVNALLSESSFLKDQDSISAGTTTVAFPLDYRLKVEAWVQDEPLISSGILLGGKIILDGGYSRFYCSNNNLENYTILESFIQFLTTATVQLNFPH